MVTNDSQGLRERKKERTRDAILRASWRLFLEKGFENTTVEEISHAVEISPRTFFRYFATKEDLIFLDQAKKDERMKQVLHKRIAGETELDTLIGVFKTALSNQSPSFMHTNHFSKLIEETPSLQARAAQLTYGWEKMIGDELLREHSGDLERVFRVRVLVACFMATLRSTTVAWKETQLYPSLEKAIEAGLLILRAGFDIKLPPKKNK